MGLLESLSSLHPNGGSLAFKGTLVLVQRPTDTSAYDADASAIHALIELRRRGDVLDFHMPEKAVVVKNVPLDDWYQKKNGIFRFSTLDHRVGAIAIVRTSQEPTPAFVNQWSTTILDQYYAKQDRLVAYGALRLGMYTMNWPLQSTVQ